MSNGGVYDICVRFDKGVAAPRGALSNLQAHDLELKRAAVSTHSKLAVELSRDSVMRACLMSHEQAWTRYMNACLRMMLSCDASDHVSL